jgi:hypothetical protein
MTGISCDCSSRDFESNRCQSYAIRKARKQHECCECQAPIRPGMQYEDAHGIDAYGGAWQFRTCLPCMHIREHYCPHGWIWGCLAEQIEECIGFDYRTVPV